MKTFLRSLLTRKFLLALAAIITFVANGQYDQALAALIAYVVAEGAVDVAANVGSTKTIE